MASTANVLTNLIPSLYMALDTVSRELVGFIPAVRRDSTAARAAIGQTIYFPVAPAATAKTIVPDYKRVDDGNQTFGNMSLAITEARACPIRWQGEESMQMNSPGGVGVAALKVDQYAQAMRTLVNEIEADLAGLYVDASRGVIPSDTSLFKSNLADAANVRKVLADNGAPMSDLQLVVDTGTGAALRTLTNLNSVADSGTDSLLRQGVLLNIHGMAIRESAQVITPAIGTENGGTTSSDNKVVGDVSIALAASGTGTVVDGDLVTIANTGDTTTQYVSSSLVANVNSGTLTINKPGLQLAITADTLAIACYKSSARCMAFDRNAILLATRMPALPEGGDMASERTTITDPRSGLSFDVAIYKEYHQTAVEISIAWGVKALKSEHIAILAA
jgi:hypothetical protein